MDLMNKIKQHFLKERSRDRRSRRNALVSLQIVLTPWSGLRNGVWYNPVDFGRRLRSDWIEWIQYFMGRLKNNLKETPGRCPEIYRNRWRRGEDNIRSYRVKKLSKKYTPKC